VSAPRGHSLIIKTRGGRSTYSEPEGLTF
jgi:hypothetical protein